MTDTIMLLCIFEALKVFILIWIAVKVDDFEEGKTRVDRIKENKWRP